MPYFHLSGGGLVFLGALFWSLNSPLIKFISLDSIFVCSLRAAIAAVALGAFIRPKQLKWNGWMLLYVCSYAALCLSVVAALKMTSAPIAVGMQYSSIIWLFLGTTLWTRRVNLKALLPVGVILMGVVFFMCSGTDATSTTGNLIALAEGVFFAVMTISAKRVTRTNPIGMVAVANVFTAVVAFAISPAELAALPAMTTLDWVVMLVLGVVQVGGGYSFYNMGVMKVSPQKASVIALWEMILGPVWVAAFLGEIPSMLELIGFVIIIIGIFMDSKMNAEETTPVEEPARRQAFLKVPPIAT